ncbi:putative toxin-antitoxin system toxin component, PIN family [Fibrobacter sp. UWR3]|uniref:putative toxin-antitoxin system toxin component, PIN family n=1 Tax=Fibrobacter sp. UWR3 TaxID=1896217 RepID=UPI00091EBD13|nr:putative toxin-antitoxin system toxin component, PIN family [Fibrobacter sp. UWR3]SHN11601.1 putative toxin-antitoxin system toxin component, PIN family [Fibrobacter sp. UWR3]
MRRICLDTNCLLMSLPSKSPYHQIWTEFLNGDLEICVSPEILLEYEEIISQKISSRMATILMEALTNRSNLVRTTPTWRFNLITQDPDDNKFVDCAICGMAEYIVSNDRHFDILKSIDFPLVTVRSIQEFSKELADEM